MSTSGLRRRQSMRPRSRLMMTLGLELISSETVAVVELVKNAFDADATHVLVRLSGRVVDGVVPAGDGVLEVLDDGVGMSSDVIAGTWLEPATPHRRRQTKTGRGRRILGEKGVGRFAAAKLGRRLTMVSRSDDENEIVVEFDWTEFEDENRYLDEIGIAWIEREPEVFADLGDAELIWRRIVRSHLDHGRRSGSMHRVHADRGTLLRMAETRVDWDESLVRSVKTTLSRLVSPFGREEGLASDFTIVLDVPEEFGTLGGEVEPPEELDRPHYTLSATVDAVAIAHGEITLKDGTRLDFVRQLQNADKEVPDKRNILRSGPYTVRLRVWDRDAESLAATAGNLSASSVRRTLDDAAGISIYRDGFRVLPYGEPRDDWLRLDIRRVQAPTRRLSNNQIVGYLLIGRDTNPELIDQTNREGIVEGPAFEDLRSTVLQLLVLLEGERYKIRPRRDRPRKGGLLERIDLAELQEAIAAKIPTDSSIASMVSDLQARLDQRTEEVGQVLARYHRLATLGQLIDRVVHELGQPLVAVTGAAELGLERAASERRVLDPDCTRVVEELAGRLTTVRDQGRVATDVVRRITPFGGRRRGRPPKIQVESAIADAVGLLRPEIADVGAAISLPPGRIVVTVDGAELQEVIVNLLTNSLHWLRHVPRGKRKIEIRTSRNPDGSVSVCVEDSGPGVRQEDQDHIFDPYFTTREGGVGLGLSIAGEIVEEFYGGELELLPPGELGGALFRATLRRRVGDA